MHDDDGLEHTNPLVVRHYDTPVSVREMLHGLMDRLLDSLIERQETMGAASITVLGAEGVVNELFGGKTLMLALDLDPHECPGCEDCEGFPRHGE